MDKFLYLIYIFVFCVAFGEKYAIIKLSPESKGDRYGTHLQIQ